LHFFWSSPLRLAVASIFPISAMTSLANRDAARLSRDEQKVPVRDLGAKHAAHMLLGISIHSGTVERKRWAEEGKPTGSRPPEWPVTNLHCSRKVHKAFWMRCSASADR
jgi:hypothetical protein